MVFVLGIQMMWKQYSKVCIVHTYLGVMHTYMIDTMDGQNFSMFGEEQEMVRYHKECSSSLLKEIGVEPFSAVVVAIPTSLFSY